MTLECYKNGGYLSKLLDSGKAFFDISVNTDVIGVGFEADTTDLLQLSDKCLVKKLLTSNQLFLLLVISFLIRTLSVSPIRWACCC